MPRPARAPEPVRSRQAFDSLSASRERGRSGPIWVVRAPLASDDARVEVAYAIGRAVGTAVVRNRLRRRLRALMRTRVADGLGSGRYLVGTRPSATELTFDQLAARLDAALGDLP